DVAGAVGVGGGDDRHQGHGPGVGGQLGRVRADAGEAAAERLDAERPGLRRGGEGFGGGGDGRPGGGGGGGGLPPCPRSAPRGGGWPASGGASPAGVAGEAPRPTPGEGARAGGGEARSGGSSGRSNFGSGYGRRPRALRISL